MENDEKIKLLQKLMQIDTVNGNERMKQVILKDLRRSSYFL